MAFPNIGILNFGVSKHWNCEFWLFQTLEFCSLGFSKHWNCEVWHFQTLEFWILVQPAFSIRWNSEFWLSFQTLEFLILAFPNIGMANFGYSKNWNSLVWAFLNIGMWSWAFPNIEIKNFRYSKHWNCEFWLFQTSKLWNLAFPNVGILYVGFSKHWKWEPRLFRTWELFIFGFSKHWKSGFWLFETSVLAFLNIGIEFWFLPLFLILAFLNIGNLNFGFFEQKNSEFLPFLTFFYPKRGSALQLENISGQSSFYKNGVCTVWDVKVCDVSPFYLLTGRFLLSSWIANLDPVRLFANQKTPKLRD